MSRKTVDVGEILARVNNALAYKDGVLRLTDSKGQDFTPEQAFRLGQASLLEQILMMTDNYKGYGHLELTRLNPEDASDPVWDYGDESRRSYGCAQNLVEDYRAAQDAIDNR